MAIKLDNKRLEYRDFFKWFEGDLSSLWNVPPTLANGFQLIDAPNDLLTEFNYFAASSKYYINGVLDSVPEEVDDYFKLIEQITEHWSVTGEYCVITEGNMYSVIRPDYVFPVRDKYNVDNIIGFNFVFPMDMGKARVIEYTPDKRTFVETERHVAGNTIGDAIRVVRRVNIDRVIWDSVGTGYYRDIKGLVRELNVRYSLMQLSLNSTAYPLLQVSTQALGSGLVGIDGITPARIAGLGKSGLGLTVPPPFTGEEGARYVERTGGGLEEALAYIRMILGSLAVLSGVPEYVYGVSLTQSAREVERVMFMGQSRINRLRRSMTNTFRELGIDVTFPREGEDNATS
ncbi:MAG: hypothetical protein F4X44_12260 [Gammaproteobacteria bacterium]|nr:hypothetical protein [Gammaproteobacteria bacterium]